jgi:hypothetical protein
MKPTTIIIAALVLATTSLVHSEPATNFYGRYGSYQGSAFTYGNQKTFTNSRGEFAGSSITRDNTTTYFDKAGTLSGHNYPARHPKRPIAAVTPRPAEFGRPGGSISPRARSG